MKLLTAAAIALAFLASPAMAEKAPQTDFTVVIKDHKFVPEVLEVPAGQKIRLTVDNQDATPEEFESHDFHREKIIKGNSKAVISIAPLKAGEHKFFGEFNPKTAQGKIIAK